MNSFYKKKTHYVSCNKIFLCKSKTILYAVIKQLVISDFNDSTTYLVRQSVQVLIRVVVLI